MLIIVMIMMIIIVMIMIMIMIIMCTVNVVLIGTYSGSNDVEVGHNINYEKHYRI